MFNKSKANSVKPGMDNKQVTEINEELRLKENLNKIKYTILVLSGKGGVGKSTVATNVAVALASRQFAQSAVVNATVSQRHFEEIITALLKIINSREE